MIRALVVDDSAFMRKTLSMMLESAGTISVVDTASNGAEGVAKAEELQPDVITMDVEMPEMDGITAVRHIMKKAPCPILMVSSLTAEGADTTIEAMRAGAADFIPKRDAGAAFQIHEMQDTLLDKVESLARSRSRLFGKSSAPSTSPRAAETRRPRRSPARQRPVQLVAIGISTGGPFALQKLIPELPAQFPAPIAIVQHMPPQFTRSLADRLNALSALEVAEAEDGMRVAPGQVVVAEGGHHLTFERRGTRLVVRTPEDPPDMPHRPSVDVMFRSACEAYRSGVLAVVMTGMGKDGLQGARQIRDAGGTIYAQDEASSVVYGMPRAVAEAGLTDDIVSLTGLPAALKRACKTPAMS